MATRNVPAPFTASCKVAFLKRIWSIMPGVGPVQRGGVAPSVFYRYTASRFEHQMGGAVGPQPLQRIRDATR